MTRSVCIEKLPHKTEKCNSSDGLQVFLSEDGEYTGYCFACNTYIPNPYKDKPSGYKPIFKKKSQAEIEKEINEISSYQCLPLPERKLKKESLEYFGIKIGVSEQDGITPVTHYYPYYDEGELVGYKVRLIENKQMWGIGRIANTDLFGWEQAKATGGKKLFITEGELDAVALYQIFKDENRNTKYEEYNPAIVSLPSGAASASKVLAKHLKKIRQIFKEIVLVFDMDDAGKRAVEDVMVLIPDALVASLPAKDANECLIKGRSKACYAAVQFNAKTPKNTRIINAKSLFEKAKVPPVWGLPYPFKSWTEATRGIRKGETVYIGAAPKMGKSDLADELGAWLIKEYGWKIFMAKPEEANVKTVKKIAGKLSGKFFHDPKKEFDGNAFDSACEKIDDKLFLLNLYQNIAWENLKVDIKEAVSNGCEAVFIDPITNLVNGLDAATQNTKLQEIAQELSAMALDLNIVVFIFCHLRNPDSGPTHEEGGRVLASQFAGSRAMERSCNYMLGLEGNKNPDKPKEERNIRTLVLISDREFGEVGRWPLYWDDNTGLFNEINV